METAFWLATPISKRYREDSSVITTQEDYDVTREQLARILRALDGLQKDVEPKNKFNFAVMAEGYYDEISRLAAELATYPPLDGSYGRKADIVEVIPQQQNESLENSIVIQ